ncbi:aKG-HExxH-type peptide beta-hydroxylase [Actinoplanes sp. NPDC049265]|uniref:aKG-HExxH-type peptide beta-hydroxylase n=1 Tax=Actinoplanes sp. NPDC049265 TaxID=3363902 RepID=UPI003717AD18
MDDPLLGAWAAARLRGRITGPPPATRPGVRLLTAEHDKITFRVRLDDRDERRGLLGLAPSVPLDDLEVKHWQECLTAAWRLLVTRHRAAALLLADVLTCVVPVEADAGAGGISATSADAFGAVAISRPADPAGFAVGLLHEAQHSLLNATAHLFDLCAEPGERGYSPWRDDPRPESGILHGAYAYLAVTRFWRAEARATGEPLAIFEFCRWREAVAATAERLLAGGRLTAAGRRFTGALLDEVRPWVAEECEPRITHLARLANDDHYVRWRIRNMRPDVDSLVAAFQRGDPVGPVRSRLITDGRRALSHSPRLVAIHNLLRGGAAVDDAAELPEGRATLAPTQYRGGGGGGTRDPIKIESATAQTRETRAAAVEAALLAGDYGTIPRAYPGKDPDLELTPLIIAAGVTTRAEEVVALAQVGCEPVRVIRWIAG